MTQALAGVRKDRPARISPRKAPKPPKLVKPRRSPRAPFLPYGRHAVDQADIAAVTAVLQDGLLAHGPKVGEFERALAARVGASAACAASSGTAALHLALAAFDVGPGDACIVPAVTFLATATAARFCGAEVLFADVDPESGLMTAASLEAAAADANWPVKAVLPVHLGGRICAMGEIAQVAAALEAPVIEDACHAIGGTDLSGDAVGACSVSDAAVFSFHPVKTIACGEGGMVACNDADRVERMRRLANHGVTRLPELMVDEALSLDAAGAPNPWSYEQIELGFNYRMNELEAALGLSQLSRLNLFVRRRRALFSLYDLALEPMTPAVRLVRGAVGDRMAPHLLQVAIDFEGLGVTRAEVMRRLQAQRIGSQVHYIPLYRQPYFRARYGEQRLEGAEAFYARSLTLPLFPAMRDEDVAQVCGALARALDL